MKMLAKGSKPVHPYLDRNFSNQENGKTPDADLLISKVEMITPTEPSVSARTCCSSRQWCFNQAFIARVSYQEDAAHIVTMSMT